MTQTIFKFDGSFSGYLTAVHSALNESLLEAGFCPAADIEVPELFGRNQRVKTRKPCAESIWQDLGLKGTKTQKHVYYSFLHKDPGLQPVIYRYIAALLCPGLFGDDLCMAARGSELDLPTRQVSKEKEETERGLCFQAAADGLWYCEISPEHNLLPLLSRYCRTRFQSDPWMLVDGRRRKCLSSVSGTLIISSWAPVRTGRRQGGGKTAFPGRLPASRHRENGAVPKGRQVPVSENPMIPKGDKRESWPGGMARRAV